MEQGKLYICFHKPVTLLGFLISLRTMGKYAHCEFVYNGTVYLSNPGGVRTKPFECKKYMDIYEVNLPFDENDFLSVFNELKGLGYDYWAILLSQLISLDIEDEERFFCSELCIFILNKLTGDSLTHNFRSIKANRFSPSRLFKYLKFMEIIGEKVEKV